MLIIEYCGNATVNNLSESGDGDAALVLTALMTIMNRLLMVVKQSIVAENLMTSVERILEYGALRQEAYLKDICGPFNNKLQGQIKFEHVWLRYTDDEDYVLKDISFTIDEKEKVTKVFLLLKQYCKNLSHFTCTADRRCWKNWRGKILTYHGSISFG